MVTRRGNTAGITSRGPTSADQTITIDKQRIDSIVSMPSTEEVIVGDTIHDQGTGGEYNVEWQILADATNLDGEQIGYESLNDAVATVSETGRVTFVSEGTVGILARTKLVGTRIDCRVWTGTDSVDVFNRFDEDTLGKEMCDQIDAAIAGKTPATSKPIFTTQNHTSGVYVRNTSCWANAFDLSCISPWNSQNTVYKGGTAITPNVAVCSAHWPIANGSTIRFVTMGNVVVDRVITAVAYPPGYMGGYPDYYLVKWDTPLPETIIPAKLFPGTIGNYLPTNGRHAAMFWTDQTEKAIVSDICLFMESVNQLFCSTPEYDATRLSFNEPVKMYDSGSPLLCAINGELVLWGVMRTYGPNCHTLSSFLSDISNQISTWGVESVSVADVSAFTDFS